MDGEAAEGIRIDPADHVMVTAALARLGSNGTWDRLMTGEPPQDAMDRADVALVTAAGLLVADGDRLRPGRDDWWMREGTAMGHGRTATLRRALQHARGDEAGWDGQDAQLVLDQGRGSARIAGLLGELLPEMPMPQASFQGGTGRFLDVGVGVAAISIAMCRAFPGSRAVGLDVVPEVLDLALAEVAEAGLQDRVELRLLSVADLADEASYDLAWLPQPFIPRPAFEAGVRTAFRATRPDGWLVAPLMTPPDDSTGFERAVTIHAAHLLGGGPIEATEADAMLTDAGWVDLGRRTVGTQVVMTARKPATP